jgi:hypothetical protein
MLKPGVTMSTKSRINRLERRVLPREDHQRFVVLPTKAWNDEEWDQAVDRYLDSNEGRVVPADLR